MLSPIDVYKCILVLDVTNNNNVIINNVINNVINNNVIIIINTDNLLIKCQKIVFQIFDANLHSSHQLTRYIKTAYFV